MERPVKVLITGAAGFIGSNLCDYLLGQNIGVIGVDNYCTGEKIFLADAFINKKFSFYELDLFNLEKTKKLFAEIKPTIVIHLASNADVRFGLEHPNKDLEQGTLVTFNVLESCRLANVKKIAFSSTGSVYGEPEIFPTPENCPFPIQTSLYAANKLSAEALMQAYSTGYGIKSYIFRFVSILGERYTHGHVLDFAYKLMQNKNEIQVLGDGNQKKAYLYVGDCVRAIWHLLSTKDDLINIYNLGPDEYISVNQSLDIICKIMGVNPEKKYSGGIRGWTGDSPFIFLDCKKLKATGWKASKTISESIELTLNYILKNQWVLNKVNSQNK